MSNSPPFYPNRNPLNSPNLKRYLFDKVDRIAGLKDARIVYFDGSHMQELRPHPPICQQSYLTIVIRAVSAKGVAKINHFTPNAKLEDGRFYIELFSTPFSCGAAAISWVALTESSPAIPVLGGSSTVLSVITLGKATATAAQCGASAFRLWHESSFGDPETNRWFDSQEWRSQTMAAIDAVSIAGATGVTLKMTLQLKKSGISIRQVLEGLPRQQRRTLTADIIRANNPGISNRALKALVASGTYPKHFGKVELSNTVRLQLKDAIGATFSFLGSTSGGVIGDPGGVPDFAIAVMEEFEVY